MLEQGDDRAHLIADSVTKHDVPDNAEQHVNASRGGEGPVDHLVKPRWVSHVSS